MGETADQIERHIYDQRHELDENIHELRHKVKSAVSWRTQTQERPWTMVGLAFGAGLLTSLVIRKRRRIDSYSSGASGRWKRESPGAEHRRQRDDRTLQIWDNVKGAIAAVAVAAAKDFVERIIPGFREQYRKRRPDQSALLGRSA